MPNTKHTSLEITRRCQGHCCKLFQVVDYPHLDKLWESYSKWSKGPTNEDPEGIHILAPMLISRGYGPDGSPLFTCKHLSKGNCTIYDIRPQMCRDLGTVNTCTNSLCRLDPKNDHWWNRLKTTLTSKRRLSDIFISIKSRFSLLFLIFNI